MTLEKGLDLKHARILAVGLSLGIFFLFLYLPTVNFDFIDLDDPEFILARSDMLAAPTFWETFKAICFQELPRQEPLLVRDLSWSLNALMFGVDNPFGYHAGNVILHGLNAVLLFSWLFLLTGKLEFPFFVTLLHFCNPVHAEPVSWAMGRKDLLSTFFVLLTLLLFTRARRTTHLGWRRSFYILSLICTLAALLSKITGMILPGLLALYLWFEPLFERGTQKNRITPWSVFFREKLPVILPHGVMTAIVVAWYFHTVSQTPLLQLHQNTDLSRHLVDAAVMTPIVLVLYLKMLFLFHPLSIFYSWPADPPTLSPALVAASFAITVLLTWAGVVLWRKKKLLFFYFAAFFLAMAPYFELVKDGLWIANRYLYFSGFAIMAMFTAICLSRPLRHFQLGRCLLVLLAAISIYQTHHFQAVFRDDEALWRYELRKENPDYRAYLGMVKALYFKAQKTINRTQRRAILEEAEALGASIDTPAVEPGTQKAARLLFPMAYYRGLVAGSLNRDVNQQISLFREALGHRPNAPSALKKLSQVYYQFGKNAPTEAQKEQAIRNSFLYLKKYLEQTNRPENKSIEGKFLKEFPFLKD